MAKADGKKRVERLKPGETIRDTEIRGFGALRQRKGIYYFVYCRVRGDLQWNTIGRHDDPYKVEDSRRA